jgi:hypothetical protein
MNRHDRCSTRGGVEPEFRHLDPSCSREGRQCGTKLFTVSVRAGHRNTEPRLPDISNKIDDAPLGMDYHSRPPHSRIASHHQDSNPGSPTTPHDHAERGRHGIMTAVQFGDQQAGHARGQRGIDCRRHVRRRRNSAIPTFLLQRLRQPARCAGLADAHAAGEQMYADGLIGKRPTT